MEYSRPNIIPTPWAYGGTFETIPAQQVSAGNGRASWDTGFPLENTLPVSSGGVPANYNDFQGVLHDLSEHTCWQQVGGMYLWSSSINYPVGAIVQGSDNKMYRALAKNGPDTTVANPVSDSSGKWTGFVHTTGSQTIKGATTFASGITVSSGATISGGMIVSGGATISGGITGSCTSAGVAAKATYYVSGGGSATIAGIGGNGKTVRFPGGLQICYSSGTLASSGTEISFGSAFSETPSIMVTARPASDPTVTHCAAVVSASTTGAKLFFTDGATLRAGNFFYVATGKWK